MKVIACIFIMAGLALGGCQSNPQVQQGDGAEIINDRLYRVDGASLDKVYVDPARDFSHYDSVKLHPLALDEVEIVQPTSTVRLPGNPQWRLNDDDMEDMRKAYREAFVEELNERGRFSISSDAGDKVLVIAARITRIAPKAPKDDFESRPAGRSSYFSEGAGAVTIAYDVIDASSGEVLAKVEDKWLDETLWRSNNSVTNRAEMLRMFRSWALRMSKELERGFGTR